MNFLVRVHQPNGCDYTIECGTQTFWLKADSMEAAIDELRGMVVGVDEDDPRYDTVGSGYQGEYRLNQVEIFEVGEHHVCPVEDWYAARQYELQMKQIREHVDEERQQYLRLKAKYEQR